MFYSFSSSRCPVLSPSLVAVADSAESLLTSPAGAWSWSWEPTNAIVYHLGSSFPSCPLYAKGRALPMRPSPSSEMARVPFRVKSCALGVMNWTSLVSWFAIAKTKCFTSLSYCLSTFSPRALSLIFYLQQLSKPFFNYLPAQLKRSFQGSFIHFS